MKITTTLIRSLMRRQSPTAQDSQRKSGSASLILRVPPSRGLYYPRRRNGREPTDIIATSSLHRVTIKPAKLPPLSCISNTHMYNVGPSATNIVNPPCEESYDEKPWKLSRATASDFISGCDTLS